MYKFCRFNTDKINTLTRKQDKDKNFLATLFPISSQRSSCLSSSHSISCHPTRINPGLEESQAKTYFGAFQCLTRMWANAQRDGRPAEHRWRPLFNAAKFG